MLSIRVCVCVSVCMCVCVDVCVCICVYWCVFVCMSVRGVCVSVDVKKRIREEVTKADKD